MKNLLPFLMIAFVTISCSNEIEESYLQNDLLKASIPQHYSLRSTFIY